MTKTLEKTTQVWEDAKEFLTVPRTGRECKKLVSILDELLTTIGGDEKHPLARLADTISTLIKAYEDEHVNIPKADSVSVLKFLMEEHGLKQKDMKEIGSQGIVSEVLSGKRKLKTAQIRRLANRFNVSPSAFID